MKKLVGFGAFILTVTLATSDALAQGGPGGPGGGGKPGRGGPGGGGPGGGGPRGGGPGGAPDPQALFDRLDTTKDNLLKADDGPGAARVLGKADADGNGEVTFDEFKAFLQSQGPGKGGPGGGGPRGGGGPGGAPDPEAIFKKLDTDGDGNLSDAELGPRAARFQGADTDGTPGISLDEFKAFLQSHGPGKGGPGGGGPGGGGPKGGGGRGGRGGRGGPGGPGGGGPGGPGGGGPGGHP
jgi:hypothetical protein